MQSVFFHYFSRVSAKPMIKNRNNTGAMLLPCYTPTLNGIVVSALPIFNLTVLFLYILSIAYRRFGGHPYLCSTLMTRTWFDMSNAFTRLANRTHVGRLWLWRKCNNVLIVKLPYWHPTPGVDPNWYLTPCSLIILNNRVHNMLLNSPCAHVLCAHVTCAHRLCAH